MTTLDPSHIPSISSKPTPSRHQAVIQQPESFPLHIPAIPDLRYEQGYLRSIAPYIYTSYPTSEASEGEINVNWAGVLWITTRDQLISPLAQGLIRAILGHLLRPVMTSLRGKFSNIFSGGPVVADRSSPRRDGQFVERLRSWSRGLTNGIETNVVLSK